MVPCFASTFVSCWVTGQTDVYGVNQTVTRCRISGGETVDYASDSSVPSVLYPNLGTDLTGQCWFYTSAATPYVILDQYADGSANVGFDTDPSNPGGIVAIGPTVPRCTTEPTVAADPAADAWEYVMSYIHPPPTPDLSPRPGQGITGLATFVSVPVPDDHAASLVSGATTLDVEIWVDAVVIGWGDGDVNTYPPIREVLSGFPDGSAQHVYETHDPDGSPLSVEYDWTARWRVSGGPWQPLPVPNTGTTVDYPVTQVIARLTN